MVKRTFIKFKKEAFILFEGLLIKIKNDLIKFLMNLNIVVSNEDINEKKQESDQNDFTEKKLAEMKNVQGQGKFKHCHGNT